MQEKNSYSIFGRGGLHDIIREVVTSHTYKGYFDSKSLDRDYYLGDFAAYDASDSPYFILGFASIRNMLRRADVYSRILSLGGSPVNAVSSAAHLFSTVNMGSGNVILPTSCISANVRIGSNCIVFSKVTIEHDSVLGDNVNVAPGVTTGGSVTIGSNVFIGAGTVIRDGVRIGDNVVVGAGSLVLEDIPEGKKAYGHPATVRGENQMYDRP